MMKLIVEIFLVFAKITVIGFDLIFAVKSGLSACGYSFQERTGSESEENLLCLAPRNARLYRCCVATAHLVTKQAKTK